MLEIIVNILGVGIFGGFFYFIAIRPALKRRRMNKYGKMATAKVIKAIKTDITYGNGEFPERLIDFILEVENDDKTLNISQAFKPSDMPKPGDIVSLLIDTKNPSNIMITGIIQTTVPSE